MPLYLGLSNVLFSPSMPRLSDLSCLAVLFLRSHDCCTEPYLKLRIQHLRLRLRFVVLQVTALRRDLGNIVLRMRLAEIFLDPSCQIICNEAIYWELLKFTLEYMPKLTISHQEAKYVSKLVTFNRRESYFRYSLFHNPRLTSSKSADV